MTGNGDPAATGRRWAGARDVAAMVLALLLAAALPAVLLLWGPESQAPSARVPPAAPPAPPPPPGALPPSPGSPFTGLATDPAAPVLAVKIDNVPRGRPQVGLALADLVYVEPVEAGLSRLLAVYQSRVPPEVGPVRSVRETDLQLLANLGRPALAFSGEAPELRPLVARAPVLDVSAPERPAAYRRDADRPTPHNLFADPARLRIGGAPPRDIGFRFGPVPPGGVPTPTATARYPGATIGMQWAPAERRWLLSTDGAALVTTAGERVAAATVVLQRVAVRDTPIRDSTGAPSPFAATVGAGSAVVLRDGLSFDARWSRPGPAAATTFTTPAGDPLTFAPGPVWVVLVPG